MKKLKIGYLRVSTRQQKTDRQIYGMQALCDELHIEKVSAAATDRPVFERVLAKLKRGDTLLVWDMDRAFRSTEDAIVYARELHRRGVTFQAINFEIDTITADGNYAYQVNAAAAERERRKISERTKQGLEAARNRGVRLGPKPKMTDRQIQNAKNKLETSGVKIKEVAKQYGVAPWTITRSIRRLEAKQAVLADTP